MRHVTPILHCITGSAGRTVDIAEDEAKNFSAIDHGFEVIDLRLIRWIPRAVEGSTVLRHTQDVGGRPKEGKVNEVQCRPESDEKQKSCGVFVRHASWWYSELPQEMFIPSRVVPPP